jgi:hypothetical protein
VDDNDRGMELQIDIIKDMHTVRDTIIEVVRILLFVVVRLTY